MPTDITTLAIEIQSRNANSNLLKFNKNLENSDSLAKEVAKSLGIAFGAASVIAYMKSATAQSIAFNRELYNIKSIAGELNLDKIRNQLVSLDSRLGYAADNAGAFYFAYSAGVRGTEKELVNFTGEVGKLSQAIISGQIPTMDAVTSMMNAYGLKAGEVTEITDMFFQVVKQGKTTGSALANSIGAIAGVSANAGVSINDLGNAIATLTTTMPTERAITSLSSMITAFIKPTDAAKEAAKKYGIEISAAALKAKGLSGILAEMNQKVGTNTEAIAEIVPSIEGMRAAVALAGGQYKMFADNIEIFANKGGTAAQAFTAQANNLDKQITSIPVTLNKINNEVGETVKSVLTLNGVLTPAIAAFNSMDSETIKLVAHITAVVGGIAVLKGAMTAINTISAIRQKLIQQNMQKEKSDVSSKAQSEELKRLEIEKTNLAEQKSLAMKEAFSKRKIMLDKLEIASLKSKALAEAKTSFSIAQGNEMQRYQRFIQTGEGVYSPDSSYLIAQKRLESATKEFSTSQKEASEAIQNFNSAKNAYRQTSIAATKATDDFSKATSKMASAAASSSQKLSMAQKATSGFAAATKGAMAAVGGLASALGPIGAIFVGLEVVNYMMDAHNREAGKGLEALQKQIDSISKKAQELEAGREKIQSSFSEPMKSISSLAEFNGMENLSDEEYKKIASVVQQLNNEYQGLGLTYNKNTGMVSGLAKAQEALNSAMKNALSQNFVQQISEEQKKMAKLQEERLEIIEKSKNTARWKKGLDNIVNYTGSLFGKDWRIFRDEEGENAMNENSKLMASSLQKINDLKKQASEIDKKNINSGNELLKIEKKRNAEVIKRIQNAQKELADREREYQYSFLSDPEKLRKIQSEIALSNGKIRNFSINAASRTVLPMGQKETWYELLYKEGIKKIDLLEEEKQLREKIDSDSLEKQKQINQIQYDWNLKLAGGDREKQMQLMQGRYNQLYSDFLKESDFSKRMELASGMIGLAEQMDSMNKSTQSYINGVVSSVDAFQKGSIEAAREESKIYEQNPIQEQTKKLEAAIKTLSEKLGLKLDNIDRSTRNATQIKIV